MTTTRAAVFRGPGLPIEYRDIPLREPQGAEVLVEVVACTLCGSDLHTMSGRRSVPVPTILGHEVLGRVVEFGPTANRFDWNGQPFTVGDRVTWSIVAHCGACFYCERGLPQKCERQVKYGHEAVRPGFELTGGLAGHCMLAPGTSIFRVPEALPDATACPANCAGATIAAALEAAGSVAGRRILVMGAGMLGVTAIAWSIAGGAERVVACDVDLARLELASAFGATDQAGPDALAEVAIEASDGRGVDVILELTGASESIEASLPLLRLGGTMVLVGSVFPTRAIPILPEQIVRRCLTIRGVHNYAPTHLGKALELLAAGPIGAFEQLVSAWEPLEGLECAMRKPLPAGKLRLGIRPLI